MSGFFSDLQARGLVEQVSDPALGELLDRGGLTAYAGFDPTATSLHIGSLMPLLGLVRLQRAGHRPIALVGGATGLVGDPSGKAEERKLLSKSELGENVAGVRAQLERFLDFDGPQAAQLVNNADWFAELGYLDFLRDVGKHFSLGAMLGKESVRQRLEREQGISYTEFSYMLVQAYDFLWLSDNRGCSLQIGGTDQWGNITAGIELTRRVRGRPVYGLTGPLITTADGKKFGKTEAGAIWLDAQRTSPYQMFQYFLNVDDRDVIRYLRYFTFLPLDEIAQIERAHNDDAAKREAQRILAREVTALVHGKGAASEAEQAGAALFGGSSLDALINEPAIPRTELPRAQLDSGLPLARLLVETKLCASTSAAQRDISGGGIYLNNDRIGDPKRVVAASDLQRDHFVVLRKGKKSYHVVKFA